MSLRSMTIRLAHTNESLRPHLLAALKQAGTHVPVRDLPHTIQRALKHVGYGRRDIEVEAKSDISVQSMGGDGYQSFVVVLNIDTGDMKEFKGSWGGPNPFSRGNQVDEDDSSHAIPVNGAAIRGTRGGGHPVWAKLYVNPYNMPQMIPQKVELTEEEDWVLAILDGLKPGARAEAFERRGLGYYGVGNPLVIALANKGLVKSSFAGVQITTTGKNSVNPRLRP